MLVSVTVHDHAVQEDLFELRHELAWEGVQLREGFHAGNDNKHVRKRVFDILARYDFRVDATLFEKRKVEPQRRSDNAQFYGFAWYHHLTGLVSALAPESEELLVTAADIGKGSNAMRSSFASAIGSIASAVAPDCVIKDAMWAASSAPLLQVADYCAWAIQRKWERDPSDTNCYDLILDKIASEYDIFRGSATTYY